VPDAHEALRKQVQQETAQEFIVRQASASARGGQQNHASER
jgi:hypothetical protein